MMTPIATIKPVPFAFPYNGATMEDAEKAWEDASLVAALYIYNNGASYLILPVYNAPGSLETEFTP